MGSENAAAARSCPGSLSTNAGLAAALCNAESSRLGLDYIDRYPELIRAVGAEEVNAAVRKYFRPDHLTVVIAGDFDAAQGESAPVA